MKNRGCALELMLVLAILIVLFVLVQSVGLPTGLADFLKLPQPTPTILMQPAVIDQIKPLGQLHTASYFLSTVVDTQMKIGALNQVQRVLLVACGKVDAGVDLAKLQATDIQRLGDRVVIRLPAPEVFTHQVFDDRQCTYVVMRDEGLLLPPNFVLETAAREAAVANFKETALANGILEQARTNAEGEIRRLLSLVNYKDVQFVP
ncbi:MAG: DUF4230 domain-containing protein [Thermoflexales bacterium]|nr:DUF4230 domain-containing protein [Thermoflexales bacterium]